MYVTLKQPFNVSSLQSVHACIKETFQHFEKSHTMCIPAWLAIQQVSKSYIMSYHISGKPK